MNDYDFGNYICNMRTMHGYSQSQLADELGITPQAVSKWENGVSKPKTSIIKKMAEMWNVTVDDILQCRMGQDEKVKITKIVITGGPCAGKTTGMSWIQNAFTERGYQVLFVPEAATELINAGVSDLTCKSNEDFQECILKMQLEKERVFQHAAEKMKVRKVLIVCDRGALDNKAYMKKSEFHQVMKLLGVNEVELRDGYDAVFHLETAAKGAEEFYTTENNTARRENLKQAREVDDKLIAAWTGHQHLRIIQNAGNFETKMKKLISEIASFLGEPEPYEIERKFLIEYPDIEALENMPNCHKVEISQTYLKSDTDEEVRIRQRGENGHYLYFETRKRKINDMKRIEVERRLTADEYLNLMMKADTSKRTIVKNRYCLTDDNQYFEIDIYPFWKDKAIVEIELSDENEKIRFPKYLKLIKEVTGDESYKNSRLADYNQ